MLRPPPFFCFFFFNDTATTEIYTLSLHDALPISCSPKLNLLTPVKRSPAVYEKIHQQDRKSTRLNSSHLVISYAVFCLKKKNTHRAHAHPDRLELNNSRVLTMRAIILKPYEYTSS